MFLHLNMNLKTVITFEIKIIGKVLIFFSQKTSILF